MTQNQLQLFVIFMIIGIFIGLFFDIFRILRKSFKHKDFIIYIQDFLFWAISGLIILYSTFIFNSGEFRAFMFFGAIFGFFSYLLTISKYFIKINVGMIKILKKIFLRIILIPLISISKLFLKPITFLVINIKKKKEFIEKSSIYK